MNKITTDEQFIAHLAKHIGIGEPLANWYWFGGEAPMNPKFTEENPEFTDESLHIWIEKQIDYRGDSDNPDEYYQHMYDEGFLSFEAINYISSGRNLPQDRVYMCFWGDGYVDYMADVNIECHGLSFFSEDMGFDADQKDTISELHLGGSTEIRGLMEIMSVVRVS